MINIGVVEMVVERKLFSSLRFKICVNDYSPRFYRFIISRAKERRQKIIIPGKKIRYRIVKRMNWRTIRNESSELEQEDVRRGIRRGGRHEEERGWGGEMETMEKVRGEMWDAGG